MKCCYCGHKIKKKHLKFSEKPDIYVITDIYIIRAYPSAFYVTNKQHRSLLSQPLDRTKTNVKRFYYWLENNRQILESTKDYRLVYMLLALDAAGIEYYVNSIGYKENRKRFKNKRLANRKKTM